MRGGWQAFIILFLLLAPLSLAATAAAPATNPLDDPVLRLVVSEGLKTREDIKSALDLKVAAAGEACKEQVNANFIVQDQRLNEFSVKLRVALAILWFSTNILAWFSSELIFRKIYKRAIQSRSFREDNQPQTPAISPEIENMIIELYRNMTVTHPEPAPDAVIARPVHVPEKSIIKEGFLDKLTKQRQRVRELKAKRQHEKESAEASKKILKLIAEQERNKKALALLAARMPQPIPEPPPADIVEEHANAMHDALDKQTLDKVEGRKDGE